MDSYWTFQWDDPDDAYLYHQERHGNFTGMLPLNVGM